MEKNEDEITVIESIAQLSTEIVSLSKAVIPNNKLFQFIEDEDLFSNGGLSIACCEDKSIKTLAKLIYHGNDNYINEYERAIYNAIASHYIEKNKVITPAMIYRTLTGKIKTKANPSPEQKAKISKAIEKFGLMRAEINVTDELIERKLIKKNEKYTLNQNLISYTKISKSITTSSGEEIEVDDYYLLNDTPILYKYANMIRQVYTIPIEVLNVPVSMNELSISIKNILIRRIEMASNQLNKKTNFNILDLKNLYDELDIDKKNKDKTRKVRNIITKMLDYWKSISYIKDYQYVYKKKEISTLNLIVNYNKKHIDTNKHSP